MSKYKVVVYAICKNEESFVERWVASMKEADQIIVLDTGSTDQTIALLKKRGVIVYQEQISPWRFDVARNQSLHYVPKDTDICVCTDLDEVFDTGWREQLEQHWDPSIDMINYVFNWKLKEDGSPDVQFRYFKIHAYGKYQWKYPIHECLEFIGSKPEKKKFVESIVLNHHPDNTKSRSSYLPLLEIAVAENPKDSRMRYYLGREYMYDKRWEACITQLELYLQLPTSNWKEERCAAMRWIANAQYHLKKIDKTYQYYHKAIAEMPWMREPYIEFSKVAYTLSDWDTVIYMVKRALRIKQKSTNFVNMGYCWDSTPYDLIAIALFNNKQYKESLMYAKQALLLEKQNPRLKNNVKLIEGRIQLHKIIND